MADINYSIIIPHKNSSKLLERCILSIPIQRGDIEILVVDDNSTEEHQVYLEKIGNLSSRISIIFAPDGKGAGYARNIGLQNIVGKWVVFADADDYFVEKAFESFDKNVSKDYGVIYFKHKSVYSDTGKDCERFSIRNELIDLYIRNSNSRNEYSLRLKDITPWAKIFNHKLIIEKKVKFDEVSASNDVTFVSHVAFYSSKIKACEDVCYVCTYRPGSITRVQSKENMFSRYLVAVRYNNFVEQSGYSEYRFRLLSYIIKAYRFWGASEAVRYIKTARSYKANIFANVLPAFSEILKKVQKIWKRHSYSA